MINSIQNQKGLKIVLDVSILENPIGLVFVQHGLGGFKDQKHIQLIANTFLKHGYTS